MSVAIDTSTPCHRSPLWAIGAAGCHGPAPVPPVPFDDFLEDQNRRGAAAGPVAFHDYLGAQNRLPIHDSAAHDAATRDDPSRNMTVREVPAPSRSRLCWPLASPRLGDLPPLPKVTVARRMHLVYRVEVPTRAGRVIDILT